MEDAQDHTEEARVLDYGTIYNILDISIEWLWTKPD